jgi:type IV fimbrial biogenesis protein FimT
MLGREKRRVVLNASSVRKSAGFSIVELMIAVVIMAILMALALPSFRTWMQNIQIRNAGGAITNGMQKARGEAVARNTNVSFVLGTDSSWTVSVVNPASIIESRPSAETSGNVTVSVLPAGATTVTFNNFGVLVANGDGSASITLIDLTAAGASRDMRVTIGVGGNARMCDPSLTTGSSPSAC